MCPQRQARADLDHDYVGPATSSWPDLLTNRNYKIMAIFKKKVKQRSRINYVQVLQAIQPQLLENVIGHCLVEGVSVNLFPLKDQSAVGLSLYKDGDSEKFFCGSKKELERTLYSIMDGLGYEAQKDEDELELDDMEF